MKTKTDMLKEMLSSLKTWENDADLSWYISDDYRVGLLDAYNSAIKMVEGYIAREGGR